MIIFNLHDLVCRNLYWLFDGVLNNLVRMNK